MPRRRTALAILITISISAARIATAATDPAAGCTYKKAKAAGKKASAVLAAFGKNASKSDLPRLAADLSKVQSKFTRRFDSAGAAGGCSTVGDAHAIESMVDALATEVLSGLTAECGDGVRTADEECDDGNPDDGDCCASNCRLDLAGTPCVPDDGNVCTDDVCDGNGTCEHLPNNAPCDDGIFCNGEDLCDATSCRFHSGDPCVGGPGCDGTCNEVAESCFADAGTACGDSADTECTDSDTCNGSGVCEPNHAADGSGCGDGGTECTNQDTCLSGACQDNGFELTGTACGDPADTECTAPDTCDGTGACLVNHAATGASCGDPADTECTDPDTCNGSGACLANHAVHGIICADGGFCNETGVCVPCDCCSFGGGLLSFETTLASGNCGVLRNFRCSNNANNACVVDANCGVSNTCNEVIGGGLPLDLRCGGLYTGGGGNSVPLPFPVPDMVTSYTKVTSCDPDTGVVMSGPTAPGDGGGIVTNRNCTTGRTCTGGTDDGDTCVIDSDCDSNACTTNCRFGPPLPIPNAMIPPTSVCTINDVAEDVSATTQCDGGGTDVSAPLRSNVYLTGDLFTMTMPPNIPGTQPCPLCDRFCAGGTDADFPCDANSDCNSSACETSTRCLGGPNDGLPCTPVTSDSATLGSAYPTSQDCPPEPSLSITDSIGGLPIAFDLTSGTIQKNARNLNFGAGGSRVFSGFCRDSFSTGSGCFEGATDVSCPDAAAGDLNGVPCNSDADCAAPYESCAQRTAGAFSRAAATQINLFGRTDGRCVGDGLTHGGDLVSVFGVPPTFNPTVDAASDLPGPGAAMVRASAQLAP